jgi:hypothetical protein
MLKRMEELVVRTEAKSVAESSLDILRRNVKNADGVLAGKWTAGDRVQMDSLVNMAVKHIDDLKKLKDDQGRFLDRLPTWAELFGRAYILTPGQTVGVFDNAGWRWEKRTQHLEVIDQRGDRRKVEDQMNYGTPVTWHARLKTWTSRR